MSNPMRALLALTFTLSSFAVDPLRPGVAVHEWGTFTTVAAEDGSPMSWRPTAPTDLPCFVERITPFQPKSLISTLVRMETPVLYFYAQRQATLSVRVDFPKGLITEWYPKASALSPAQAPFQARHGRIEWNSVEILPNEPLTLPSSKGTSHYFSARATDAAPLRVNGQTEKMLFYRGVGDFQVPVKAKFDANGRLQIRNTGSAPLPVAIYFENRGGKVGYRVARGLAESIDWEIPETMANPEAIHEELARELVRAGLYPKEAAAMVETWRDTWFEAGTRVFYIVPRTLVDAVLPLQIEPAPTAVERVFVGRVELLAPWRKSEMLAATEPQVLFEAGRFLDPFATQIKRTSARPLHPAAYTKAAQQLWDQNVKPGCVQ